MVSMSTCPQYSSLFYRITLHVAARKILLLSGMRQEDPQIQRAAVKEVLLWLLPRDGSDLNGCGVVPSLVKHNLLLIVARGRPVSSSVHQTNIGCASVYVQTQSFVLMTASILLPSTNLFLHGHAR